MRDDRIDLEPTTDPKKVLRTIYQVRDTAHTHGLRRYLRDCFRLARKKGREDAKKEVQT